MSNTAFLPHRFLFLLPICEAAQVRGYFLTTPTCQMWQNSRARPGMLCCNGLLVALILTKNRSTVWAAPRLAPVKPLSFKQREADHDVDYLFGQVAIDQDFVDWSGNCGNLSAAVGPSR